ncbi:MAG TPA: hypothetical protein VF533_09205 [Solirubrobacteraceae bacterium]|jgi:hypothetical protein
MRRAAIAGVVLAVVAGCGGGGDERERVTAATATPIPSPTPVPSPSTPAEVARRLAAGEIGVVDFERRALIAPRTLRANKEQVLSGVVWEGWGGPRATGRGSVRTLVCDPSCAQGRVERAAGELTLSGPRVCGDARYYSAGRLVYGEDRQAASVFLLTPC